MLQDITSYTILTVEDNPGDFVLIQEYLEERIELPRVIHAPDFRTAAEKLEQADAVFDIILLDLTLPDKQGTILVTEILRRASEVPVIVLTGNADLSFSVASISLGVSDYLIKDEISPDALYKSIKYAIERKKVNQRLQESEARFSTLFQESPQPMCVFDTETDIITQVNNAAVELYGFPADRFVGMSLFELVPEEEMPRVREIFASFGTDDGRFFTGRFRLLRQSGEIMDVDIYSSGFRFGGKMYRSVIAIDVTEKLRYENAITRAIIKAQEDERYEIGSELHDNVCQILASAQMFMGMLQQSVEPAAQHLAQHVRNNTTLAIREIRNLSHRLAPAFFEEASLEEAIRRLIGDFSLEENTVIRTHVSEDLAGQPIPREIQLNLYRILQEQFRNIQKYARATEIDFNLRIAGDHLRMSIRDNGVGFDPAAVKGGIGIANMKRRAELFGGEIQVLSSPGHGCELVVNIPLPDLTQAATTG
jgi:PAS domain S-box-containing protein